MIAYTVYRVHASGRATGVKLCQITYADEKQKELQTGSVETRVNKGTVPQQGDLGNYATVGQRKKTETRMFAISGARKKRLGTIVDLLLDQCLGRVERWSVSWREDKWTCFASRRQNGKITRQRLSLGIQAVLQRI